MDKNIYPILYVVPVMCFGFFVVSVLDLLKKEKQ